MSSAFISKKRFLLPFAFFLLRNIWMYRYPLTIMLSAAFAMLV